jgi:UDP-N-acetylmuramate dehydrogenase
MSNDVDVVVVMNEPMGPHTTYRVGGSVARFATVTNEEQLAVALGQWGRSEDLRVVGNGSNLLVADGLQDWVVLRLAGELSTLTWEIHDDHVDVVAGAGLDLPIAARQLSAAGITGFEWAVGVPGTFGGAIAMNAGGHGSDMAASVVSVRAWRAGDAIELTSPELDFGYRHSSLRPTDVVSSVRLRLTTGDSASAKAALKEIVSWRRTHQPGGANAGSVFRNPTDDSAGRLLDRVGAKGLRVGTAMVSVKHANFIIADEGGRADDIFALMRLLRNRVRDEAGVTLIAETRLWGFGEEL